MSLDLPHTPPGDPETISVRSGLSIESLFLFYQHVQLP